MKYLKRAGFITATMFLMFFTACPGGEGVKVDPFAANMMVFVKGGTFTMGCTSEQDSDCTDWEQPMHQVTLDSFYIGKYEVTQAQWKLVMNGDNPAKFKGDNLPVENVSWYDVQAFLNRLNEMSGEDYRLPTEAEWEYAARGGAQSRDYKYSGSNVADEVAWYGTDETRPVGIKIANELGIHDMSGNVWEWASDWFDMGYSADPQTNPVGPSDGTNRVLRGGQWNGNARNVRVTMRNGGLPNFRYDTIGFRVVKNVK